MENKLTKQRLVQFLSYDWLAVIAVAFVAVFFLNMFYSMTAVKPTVGQYFKYYYDVNLTNDGVGHISEFVKDEKGDLIFSYDVLKIGSETVMQKQILTARLEIQEGDTIFSDIKEREDGIRARNLVDNNYVYSYEKLYDDARGYLAGFLQEGKNDDYKISNDVLSFENMSKDKIFKHFDKRLGEDNRFRNKEDKDKGRELEYKRIEDLVKQVNDLKKVLDYDQSLRDNGSPSIFYDYTMGKELSEKNPEDKKYKDFYEKSLKDNREKYGRDEVRYGLRVDMLKNGKQKTESYFRVIGNETAQDVVLMVFDFYKEQPYLQFETISFFNQMVRTFSDILN